MKTLVIAPHPDDELLAAGGTLLKRAKNGNEIGWLIMTRMEEKFGWNKERIELRNQEIDTVRIKLGINQKNLFQLPFPTTKLDEFPLSEIISHVSSIFKIFRPEELFIPHYGDIHTDHRITFDVAASCSKWFRNKSVRNIYCYETISESEYNLISNKTFFPNYFVDITDFYDQKIDILNTYESEISQAPFPRSEKVLEALSIYRGSQCGYNYAEAFNMIKGID